MTNAEKFCEVFGYEPTTDAVVCNKEDWCGASEPCKYCDCYSDAIGREEDWWGKEYKACFEIKPEFEGVEVMAEVIKYTSQNGYTGILYGKSSFKILDEQGKMVFHTGLRTINTEAGLIEQVESFPELLELLHNHGLKKAEE